MIHLWVVLIGMILLYGAYSLGNLIGYEEGLKDSKELKTKDYYPPL